MTGRCLWGGIMEDLKYGTSSCFLKRMAGVLFLWVSLGTVTTHASSTLDDGLVGYWQFDGGVFAADASGSGHYGTLVNSASYASGKFDQAVNFPASTSAVIVSPSPDLADLQRNTFSVSLWVYPRTGGTLVNKGFSTVSRDGLTGWKLAVFKFDPPNPPYGLYFEAGQHDGSGPVTTFPYSQGSVSTSIIVANAWNHIVMTRGDQGDPLAHFLRERDRSAG